MNPGGTSAQAQRSVRSAAAVEVLLQLVVEEHFRTVVPEIDNGVFDEALWILESTREINESVLHNFVHSRRPRPVFHCHLCHSNWVMLVHILVQTPG